MNSELTDIAFGMNLFLAYSDIVCSVSEGFFGLLLSTCRAPFTFACILMYFVILNNTQVSVFLSQSLFVP